MTAVIEEHPRRLATVIAAVEAATHRQGQHAIAPEVTVAGDRQRVRDPYQGVLQGLQPLNLRRQGQRDRGDRCSAASFDGLHPFELEAPLVAAAAPPDPDPSAPRWQGHYRPFRV
ncbi:MAG: hypothetical protein U5L11_05885 [Arhodomonas sp.]|nr:hypothetical protein [Arhodomonas sp.]